MTYDFTGFQKILDQWQVSFSKEQQEQLTIYYEMLVEKNKVMNLTAITEFEDVLEKHFLDSLAVAQFVDLKQELSVIDLGTGAGFPGLPLKILFPNLKMTLADSLNKRILFLDEVIVALGLSDIWTVHGRAEDLAVNVTYREQFALCVSRAVANLSSLSEYCLPFVKLGGSFISYKSGEIEEELASAKHAIFLLGGKLDQVVPFQLDGTDISRSFVMIEKTKKTPKAYPRKSGMPTKKPLG
jgi:16S rRNA (guanine527-N7)-methyltransferase